MKRKRGNKKGKHKKPSSANAVSVNTEDSSLLENLDDAELDSEMEVQVPASMGSGQPAELTKTHGDGFTNRPAGQSGLGRVKVKLKSSKLLDPQPAHSDAQTQSDTDKSSSHLSLEKQGEVVEKLNDGANLSPEIQPTVSGQPRKAGSIKFKSSRGLGSLINQPSTFPLGQGEQTAQIASDNHKTVDSSMSKESQQWEHKLPHRDPRYNEQELNSALTVIKKIMKMDAAEPFNAPVNPVALGIPDYFDIIETPMDFGTICNNLEQRNTYMNSEDVYKDVQYIWENCYRYNNKGDYIVDLMKRVKKNFTKYWMAAGLHSDQQNKTSDASLGPDFGIELPLEDDRGRERILEAGGRMKDTLMSKQENVVPPSLYANERLQVETAAPSSQERLHVKGTYSKQKTRRRHGINRHKSDCLCAVCVVRRRRKEREGIAKIVENQIEISDGNMSQEFRQEEICVENPCSEDASSNLGHSPDPAADADLEEQGKEMKLERPEQQESLRHEISENKVEIQTRGENEPSQQFQLGDGSGEEPNPQSRSEEMEDSGIIIQNDILKDDTPPHEKKEATEFQKLQQKQDNSQKRRQQNLMCKNLLLDVNPAIVKLCGTLFPNERKSVWNGSHSLVCHDIPACRSSAIHLAIEMFMK